MEAKKIHAPRVEVRVRHEHILFAKPRSSSHCMIAEAIRSAYPSAKMISVDLQTIRFSDPERGQRFTYLTPRDAQVALVNWDDGVLPTPFRFTLRGGQVTVSGSRRASVAKVKRDEKLLSVPDFAERVGVASSVVYARLARGTVASVKVNVRNRAGGTREETRIPESEIAIYNRKKRAQSSSSPSHAPTVVGGTPPPLSEFSQRRQFGLKGLVR